MARAITKVVENSKTNVTIKRFVDGYVKDEEFTFDGVKSERAIQALLFKRVKTRNFMVTSIEVVKGTNSATYTMDAETFVKYSNICENGVSYGHDTVTATFKNTKAQYMTSDFEMHEFTFVGQTTESKLRNAIIDECGDKNILVCNVEIVEERRYMSKTDFVEKAKKS